MKTYKWIVLLINIFLLILLFLNSERLLDWISVHDDGNLFIVFLVITLLASIPGIPFGIVSGVIGAKYGILLGTSISLLTSTVSSVMIYTLIRYLLLQQGSKLLNKYRSIAQLDRVIKNHTFGAIIIARILPIMPAIVVNIYAGVFGISFKTFFWATMLGKIPVMTVYTLVGYNMLSGSNSWVIIVAIYIVFLIFFYLTYRLLASRYDPL